MADQNGRRTWLVVLGVVLALVGIGAAIALWIGAGDNRANAVDGLARAPVGCDTTLDFSESGTYIVFLETAGTIDSVRGDCGVEGTFDIGEDARPELEITIVDPDGGTPERTPRLDDVTYDEDGSRGRSLFEIDVTTTGDHRMRVESADGSDDTFAVAVGRDPNRGVAPLRLAAIAAILLGIGAAAVLIAFGARRRQPAAQPTAVWGQQPGYPQPGYSQAPGQPGSPPPQVGYPPASPPMAQPGYSQAPGQPGSPPPQVGYPPASPPMAQPGYSQAPTNPPMSQPGQPPPAIPNRAAPRPPAPAGPPPDPPAVNSAWQPPASGGDPLLSWDRSDPDESDDERLEPPS
jgi:hypothetical protein